MTEEEKVAAYDNAIEYLKVAKDERKGVLLLIDEGDGTVAIGCSISDQEIVEGVAGFLIERPDIGMRVSKALYTYHTEAGNA